MKEDSKMISPPDIRAIFPRVPFELIGLIDTYLPKEYNLSEFYQYCEEYVLDYLVRMWFVNYSGWLRCLKYNTSEEPYVLLVDDTLMYAFEMVPPTIEEAIETNVLYEYIILKDIEYITDYYDSYYFRIARYYIEFLNSCNRLAFPDEDDIIDINIQFNTITQTYECLIWA